MAAAGAGLATGTAAYLANQLTDIGPGGLGRILGGFGDYAPVGVMPKKNTLMAEMMVNGPPAIHNTSQRTFIVRHREYLGDIITGADAGFNITHYAINPALYGTFPWLAQIAQNFEQYRVRGMVFEFKSTSADALNSTNTALGSVIMATEYNSDSDPFASKAQMENHEFASSARQSCSMLHAIECAPRVTTVTELYTRTTSPPAGQDLRLYDLGRFSIATQGQQGSSVNIGELWVSYEIELLKPQIPDVSTIVGTDHIYSASGVSTSAYFGNSYNTLANQLGCTFGTTVIAFPQNITSGQYLLYCNWSNPGGTLAGCVAPSVSFLGCSGETVFTGSTASSLAVNSTGAASIATSLIVAIEVSSSFATITLSGGTLPLGTVKVDAIMTRVGAL